MQVKGRCHALFAFDVAREIDVELAERRLASPALAKTFQHKQRVALGRGRLQGPYRVTRTADAESVGRWRTTPEVEIALYPFGALCVTWSIPFDGPLEDLIELSAALYANEVLASSSRDLCARVLEPLGDAAHKAGIADVVEDYVLFHVESPKEAVEAASRDPHTVARILRAEPAPLAAQEIENALHHEVAYRSDEVCQVDWLAAFMVGEELQDELRVLEYSIVELLELRWLDAQLGRAIDVSYEELSKRRGLIAGLGPRSKELERIARMQADSAALHEGFDNVLKLYGDDYLARLYRAASERFHFTEWDVSIRRKVETLDSTYQKLSDQAGRRRSELLEWIIIALIAGEIVTALV